MCASFRLGYFFVFILFMTNMPRPIMTEQATIQKNSISKFIAMFSCFTNSSKVDSWALRKGAYTDSRIGDFAKEFYLIRRQRLFWITFRIALRSACKHLHSFDMLSYRYAYCTQQRRHGRFWHTIRKFLYRIYYCSKATLCRVCRLQDNRGRAECTQNVFWDSLIVDNN